MFDPCPSERVMNFRVWEDTAKGGKLAKESRVTGSNLSSPLNECSRRKLMVLLFLWASAPASWSSLMLDKDHKEIVEHKAKFHQVRKEKGKYKEEIIEKLQK